MNKICNVHKNSQTWDKKNWSYKTGDLLKEVKFI